MATHTGTVVNGQVQLDIPLPLSDNTRVTITVAPIHSAALQAWASIQERLAARPVYSQGQRYTRDELHERD